jgi:periplasmic divalent cation tolerance protein
MKEAKLIASHLLKDRLIACANMFPITSMFWWDGEVTEESEVSMFCKAKKESFEEIKLKVTELHSYEVPCVVALPWYDSNEDYRDWVKGETTKEEIKQKEV